MLSDSLDYSALNPPPPLTISWGDALSTLKDYQDGTSKGMSVSQPAYQNIEAFRKVVQSNYIRLKNELRRYGPNPFRIGESDSPRVQQIRAALDAMDAHRSLWDVDKGIANPQPTKQKKAAATPYNPQGTGAPMSWGEILTELKALSVPTGTTGKSPDTLRRMGVLRNAIQSYYQQFRKEINAYDPKVFIDSDDPTKRYSYKAFPYASSVYSEPTRRHLNDLRQALSAMDANRQLWDSNVEGRAIPSWNYAPESAGLRQTDRRGDRISVPDGKGGFVYVPYQAPQNESIWKGIADSARDFAGLPHAARNFTSDVISEALGNGPISKDIYQNDPASRISGNFADFGDYLIPGLGTALGVAQGIALTASFIDNPKEAFHGLIQSLNPAEPGLAWEERLLRVAGALMLVHGVGKKVAAVTDAGVAKFLKSQGWEDQFGPGSAQAAARRLRSGLQSGNAEQYARSIVRLPDGSLSIDQSLLGKVKTGIANTMLDFSPRKVFREAGELENLRRNVATRPSLGASTTWPRPRDRSATHGTVSPQPRQAEHGAALPAKATLPNELANPVAYFRSADEAAAAFRKGVIRHLDVVFIGGQKRGVVHTSAGLAFVQLPSPTGRRATPPPLGPGLKEPDVSASFRPKKEALPPNSNASTSTTHSADAVLQKGTNAQGKLRNTAADGTLQWLGKLDHPVPYAVRDGVNREQIRLGLTELARLEQSKGEPFSSLLAADYRAGKASSLHGKLVSSLKGLAQVAQVLRRGDYEIFHHILVKNGKVVYIDPYTSRLPGASAVFISPSDEKWKEHLRKLVRFYEADSVYIAHNHPSGDPTVSEEDRDVTRKVASFLGPIFKGHVVLDFNRYAVIEPSGKSDLIEQHFYTADPTRVPIHLAHPILGQPVRKTRDIVSMVQQLKDQHAYIPVIGLDSQGVTRAFTYLPMNQLINAARPDFKKGVLGYLPMIALIRRWTRAHGVRFTFPILPSGTFERLNEDQKTMLRNAIHTNVFSDVIDMNGKSYYNRESLEHSNDYHVGAKMKRRRAP